MNTVISYLLSVIVTLQTIFSLLPQLNKVTYEPARDDVILNCAVVSDTHADNNSFRDRTNILRRAYTGIGSSSKPIDVLLNAGDITNSGSRREYTNEKRLEDFYMKPKHTVACLGNHDSWNGSADPHYDVALTLFYKYLNSRGIQTDKPYYSTVVEGYTFICLATESLDLHEALPTYSEEQVRWFDGELTKAEKSGLPIFVLTHKPIEGSHGYTDSCASPAFNTVLQNHAGYTKPIIVFSGHYHNLSKQSIDNRGNVYYINLPSLEYNDETENECNDCGGTGVAMEVYDDQIILRFRNFIKDIYIDGYELIIDF